MFRVWYSTKSFADFIVDHTTLSNELENENLVFNRIYESDASNPKDFHKVPTHIKEILYLDSPDLIIEMNTEPIFTVEVSTEAGTGHNSFQRFPRIAASVENNVPAFYIYPEAAWIERQVGGRWDPINPIIFKALKNMVRIYGIPANLYYYPSVYGVSDEPTESSDDKGLLKSSNLDYLDCPDENESNIQMLFNHINLLIEHVNNNGRLENIITKRPFQEHLDWMDGEFHRKGGLDRTWSPMTATEEVSTDILINYLKKFSGEQYEFTNFLLSRDKTIIYKADAKFRGDPYPGALAGIDYLTCREGKTFEDRDKNLVMVWGKAEINDGELTISGGEGKSVEEFINSVKSVYEIPGRLLLNKSYDEIDGEDIPRYFMQVRFGSTFSKVKHVRVYSYFCDAMLFHDGVLWREG